MSGVPTTTVTEPPIDLSKSRYNSDTYIGRVMNFFAVTNPLRAFVSDAKLQESKSLLARYAAGDRSIPTDDLWEAKLTVDAVLHPQTGEKVPWAFRGNTFVFTNLAICYGMLLPGAGVATTLFWQWANQSYNVMFNHSNRNASNEMALSSILTSYSLAVATSCGLAVGGNKLLQKTTNMSPRVRGVLGAMVPFTAVASASVANVVLMRLNEALDGIQVYTEDGEAAGNSRLAGRQVLGVMALSRVALSAPILLAPPLAMAVLSKTPVLRNHPAGTRRNLIVKLGCIGVSLWAALPLAVGVFPQKLRLSVDSLEPEISAPLRARGIKIVLADKGV